MKIMNGYANVLFCLLKIMWMQSINNIIQGQILGKYTSYKSIDTIMNIDEIVNYSFEFFNSLDFQEYRNIYCHS